MSCTRKTICKYLMLGGSFLTLCGAEAPREAPKSEPKPAFTVYVYDRGPATEHDMMELEQNATAIFRDAGIYIVWVDCFRTGTQCVTSIQPGGASGQTTLGLRVVDQLDRGGPHVLGWTTLDSSVITVQYSRAQQIARTSQIGVSAGQILGHVAAHELGHLLLGSTAHTTFGVMKSTYNTQDLLKMVQSPLLFTPQQSRMLRSRFAYKAVEDDTRRGDLEASTGTVSHRQSLPTKQQGQIRIFNLAHVSGRDLFRAESEVTRIFGEAGMEIDWAEGALDDKASLVTDFSANNSSPTGCKAPAPARELRLQLLPRAPQTTSIASLGFSLPCAKFGIDSTIFIDHCERATYDMPVSFTTVLAYAMAHELGHVLLRSSEHSDTGLMRAVWDKNAWYSATLWGIPIDREQARRMRLELSRIESLAETAPSR